MFYPAGDGQFEEDAALTLRIELPESYSPEDVVREIQERLRVSYPLATVVVEPGAPDEPPTWHVHRDGLATEVPPPFN